MLEKSSLFYSLAKNITNYELLEIKTVLLMKKHLFKDRLSSCTKTLVFLFWGVLRIQCFLYNVHSTTFLFYVISIAVLFRRFLVSSIKYVSVFVLISDSLSLASTYLWESRDTC